MQVPMRAFCVVSQWEGLAGLDLEEEECRLDGERKRVGDGG